MLYENLSFGKAIAKIAKQYNFTIEGQPTEEKIRTSEQTKLIEINEETNNFYQLQLLNPPKFLGKYLNQRKFAPSVIRKYQIGWAPEDVSLYEHLQNKGFSKDDILASELVNLFSEKKVNNYFAQRLIFPLRNNDGEIVGFSGRIVNDETQTKFLVSRETSLFKKSEVVFNLSFVNQNFKALTEIYLVEGFFDAIRLTEAKLPAVALLGTQLTTKQIALLKERYHKIVIVPDGDEAGRLSALKSALALKQNDMEVRIWSHQTKLDPDELIQEEPQIIADRTKNFKNAVGFVMDHYPLLDSDPAIKSFTQEASPFFHLLSYVEKHQFLKEMESKYGLSFEKLEKEWNWNLKQEEVVAKAKKTQPEQKTISLLPIQDWERTLIFYILNFSQNIAWMKKIPGHFASSECEKIWQYILKQQIDKDEKDFEKSAFLYKIKDYKISRWFQKLFEEVEVFLPSLSTENETLWQELIDNWHKEFLKKQLKEINNKLAKKNYSDYKNAEKLQQKKIKLNNQIHERKLNIIADYIKNQKKHSVA